jgi:hypothetical protein
VSSASGRATRTSAPTSTAPCATLTCLAGLASLLHPGLRRACWALVTVTSLVVVSTAVEIHAVEITEHGVVVTKEVVARKGNAWDCAPAFADPLRRGAEFTMLERRVGWPRIRLESDDLDG